MHAAVAIKSLEDNPYFTEKANVLFQAMTYLPSRPNAQELGELLGEHDVLVIGAREKISREMLERKPPKTSVVGTLSVGTDHLDMEALAEFGIQVVRCPTANVRSVAEHALAMVLALSKHLKWGDRLMAQGETRSDLPSLPFEVQGKTLGLIGYGNIGSTLATLAQTLGINVIATARTRQSGSDGDVRFGTLDEVLGSSHFVSLHAPLTSETRGLINATTLESARRNALLINTSRRELVVETALREALDSGQLAGFAGDYDNAPADLSGRPNVLFTPHIAGITVESNDRLDNELIDRLTDHFGGKG
jgi:phosphoglycerate dehydrogenase-like enzyme